ncbi:MAG: Zn-dependent alcohol dehydrogenase, partial [Chloroflexi bacterium]|nr:Zn-dependent alcohol dehydrogenase [Chloroflexota bacterium]
SRRADGGRSQILMRMQAAVLSEPNGRFRIETVDLDPPKAGEVLVKIAAGGVCRSDWRVAIGTAPKPMPIIAGHEGAGVVEAVGSEVSRVAPGDHVTFIWAPSCGDCFYCNGGKPNLCETFTPLLATGLQADGKSRIHWKGQPVHILAGLGAFAEFAVVREESCLPIRRDVPLELAALAGCAVATGVGAATYTAAVKPGESVAVFGAGGVGLNIIQGARLCGADPIIAVDADEKKLSPALDFGATHTLHYDDAIVRRVQALTGGRGADHGLEAAGIPALQEVAFDALRPGGQLTLIGTTPDDSRTNLPGAVITRSEKVIRGGFYGSCSPRRDIPLLLDLYAAGKLKLRELVTRRYALAQINEAYADLVKGELARGVIVF